MKRFLIISAILLTAVSAQGQTTVVTGCIVDSLTRAGEPAAILQFFKDEDPSKPIAFTTTDESGRFSQTLTGKGGFRMLFSNMGRKERNVWFRLDGQDVLDLGTILIEDDVQTLKAGSVTAQKTLVKMDVDKITYKVEDDVDSKTSTVLEMLRKVPMVSVDGQDNITVNGSSSFLVYVDGKPNQMISSNPSAILKTMPASFVRKIEVVTNPGARYDAEGVGGVLNITTSSNRSEGGNPLDSQYGSIGAMGTTRGGGGNVFYSLQRGKWAFSMNGQAMYNRNKDTFTDVERVQKTADGDLTTFSHTKTDIDIPMFTGSMNLSYEIDSLNLISAGAGWMHFGMEYDGINSTLINGPDYSFDYDGTTYTRNTSNNITANADYQHLWAGMPERSFILSYQFNGNPSVNDTYNTFNNTGSHFLNLTDRRSEALVNSKTHTIQADFSTPFGNGKTHLLNIGAKFISRHNSSDQEDFLSDGKELVPDPVGSLKYDFFNNIGSVYAEYEGTAGPVGFKAGARYEHTWQNVAYSKGDGDDFRMDYGNLIPGASLQYNIGRQQNLGLSYNMRISRPGITYLNPYVNISDPTVKSYGNTSLKTEMANNINLVYNYFSSKWIVNLTLRDTYTGNGISQYSFYDNGNILNTTYGNIVSSNNIGLNIFLTWIPGSRTRVIFNGGGGYNNIYSKTLSQSNSGFDYNAVIGLQQTLPWDLRLSANVIAIGRTVNLQGWNSGMAMGTLGITKSILEDRLTFSLNGVTHLTGGKGMRQTSWSEGTGFTSRTVNTIPMRTLTLSISFSFGRQDDAKVKSAKKRIQNDTELNQKSVAESLGTMMQM